MSTGDLTLHARLTLRALARRRLAVGILVVLPVAFYLATNDVWYRSVRALVFGVTWAVSTVAFFAALAARQVEPRLRLAGRRTGFLVGARLAALLVLAGLLAGASWLLVVADNPVRSPAAMAVDLAVAGVVAVAFGSAIGAVVTRELEGALILFLFAGLQAVTNPFGLLARLLPFWSSRELATWAIDGPEAGSWAAGLAHGALVTVACGVLIAAGAGRRRGG